MIPRAYPNVFTFLKLSEKILVTYCEKLLLYTGDQTVYEFTKYFHENFSIALCYLRTEMFHLASTRVQNISVRIFMFLVLALESNAVAVNFSSGTLFIVS